MGNVVMNIIGNGADNPAGIESFITGLFYFISIISFLIITTYYVIKSVVNSLINYNDNDITDLKFIASNFAFLAIIYTFFVVGLVSNIVNIQEFMILLVFTIISMVSSWVYNKYKKELLFENKMYKRSKKLSTIYTIVYIAILAIFGTINVKWSISLIRYNIPKLQKIYDKLINWKEIHEITNADIGLVVKIITEPIFFYILLISAASYIYMLSKIFDLKEYIFITNNDTGIINAKNYKGYYIGENEKSYLIKPNELFIDSFEYGEKIELCSFFINKDDIKQMIPVLNKENKTKKNYTSINSFFSKHKIESFKTVLIIGLVLNSIMKISDKYPDLDIIFYSFSAASIAWIVLFELWFNQNIPTPYREFIIKHLTNSKVYKHYINNKDKENESSENDNY